MPLPISDNGQDQDDAGLDILEDVELKSFKADPASIGPFGASVLSWQVTGPSGFHVELNGQTVTKSGHEAVQPITTTAYRLVARAGRFNKPLKTVQVAVDGVACQLNSINNPRSAIQAPLRASILSSGDIYFRDDSDPVITFSPGRIRMQLKLGKRINNFPDAEVNIDASFGLTVVNGQLVEAAEQIGVDIGFPFWATAIFGVIIQAQMALQNGKQDAINQMHNGISGLVQLLNALTIPPQGFRRQSVRVDDGSNGAGIIETTQCPFDLLVKFAAISATKVVIE